MTRPIRASLPCPVSHSAGSRAARPTSEVGARVIQLACLVATLLTVLFAPNAPAQSKPPLELRAEVASDTVSMGDVVRLTVSVVVRAKQQVKDLQMPDFSGFTVTDSRRMQSERVVDGARGRSVESTFTFIYGLRPDSPGRLTIGAAKAKLGRTTVRSSPIPITVLPARAARTNAAPAIASRPGARFSSQRLPQTFVELTLDKQEAYVGEQVTLSLILYSRAGLSDVTPPNIPLDKFWSEELESARRLRGKAVSIRGQRYIAYAVQRHALFPLEPGAHTIGPVSIGVKRGGGFFSSGHRFSVESAAVTLNALPLPDGAPAGFREGNVGELEIRSRLDKRTTSVGSPVTWTIEVLGRGHIDHVQLPDMGSTLPTGLRGFDPTTDTQKSVSQGRILGRKTVTRLVQPTKPGSYTLPALKIVAFNPALGAYATLEAPALRLEATPAALDTTPGGQAPDAPHLMPLVSAPSEALPLLPPWQRALFWPIVLTMLAAALVPSLISPLRARRHTTPARATLTDAVSAGDLGALCAALRPYAAHAEVRSWLADADAARFQPGATDPALFTRGAALARQLVREEEV